MIWSVEDIPLDVLRFIIFPYLLGSDITKLFHLFRPFTEAISIMVETKQLCYYRDGLTEENLRFCWGYEMEDLLKRSCRIMKVASYVEHLSWISKCHSDNVLKYEEPSFTPSWIMTRNIIQKEFSKVPNLRLEVCTTDAIEYAL